LRDDQAIPDSTPVSEGNLGGNDREAATEAAVEPTAQRGLRSGVAFTLLVAAMGALLSGVAVHFASYEIIKEHFSEFVGILFIFGITTLVGLFFTKTGGRRTPTEDDILWFPAIGFGALLLVVGALIWWGQWSKGEILIGELKVICEALKVSSEDSAESTKLRLSALKTAKQINSLWFKRHNISENIPCEE
jgi:hypothetical protein